MAGYDSVPITVANERVRRPMAIENVREVGFDVKVRDGALEVYEVPVGNGEGSRTRARVVRRSYDFPNVNGAVSPTREAAFVGRGSRKGFLFFVQGPNSNGSATILSIWDPRVRPFAGWRIFLFPTFYLFFWWEGGKALRPFKNPRGEKDGYLVEFSGGIKG